MNRIFLALMFCVYLGHTNPDRAEYKNTSQCVVAAEETTSANRVKYRFKIKTKTGGIVGNVLIEGSDLFNCISKLNRRYPGCEILEAKEA